MAAYVIFLKESTKDPEALRAYAGMTGAAAEGHLVELLAAYPIHEALEGLAPEGVVLLKFPDLAAAKAWYHSPAYQAALPHRLAGGEWRTILFEGI